jgi:ABC-type uncharacterized transport system substrate-binding protein
VIVAVPTASARAAKNATSTIPIVMSGVADPIGCQTGRERDRSDGQSQLGLKIPESRLLRADEVIE